MNWKNKWESIREYDDIKFDFFDGIAKISINRPEKHNAFTPRTVKEMIDANLAKNAKTRGSQLINNLNDIKNQFSDKIMEVRGKGLLTAFEMFDEPNLDGHHISVELLNQGIYAKETHHTTIRLAPALTINELQVNNLLEGVRKVVKEL